MTPAERLNAAADLLEKRADDATPGPWRDMPMGSEGANIHAGGNTVTTARRVGRIGEFADASYIATMHPEVGKALASILRREARQLADRADALGGLLLGLPEEELAVADLLLAGES